MKIYLNLICKMVNETKYINSIWDNGYPCGIATSKDKAAVQLVMFLTFHRGYTILLMRCTFNLIIRKSLTYIFVHSMQYSFRLFLKSIQKSAFRTLGGWILILDIGSNDHLSQIQILIGEKFATSRKALRWTECRYLTNKILYMLA